MHLLLLIEQDPVMIIAPLMVSVFFLAPTLFHGATASKQQLLVLVLRLNTKLYPMLHMTFNGYNLCFKNLGFLNRNHRSFGVII
jgi:hypothetical protein